MAKPQKKAKTICLPLTVNGPTGVDSDIEFIFLKPVGFIGTGNTIYIFLDYFIGR